MYCNGWMSWQIDYLLCLQNFRDVSGHILDAFFTYITMFGEVIIPVCIICLFYWVINKRVGTFILWCYLFGFVANVLAKTTACIYRPWILDCRVHPLPSAIPAATGYSFPSGHTAGAMSIWGGLAVSYWKDKLFRIFCFIIIGLVMISRNYLGVHTPQDVIVSFVLSIFVLWVSYKALNWVEKSKNNDIKFIGIVYLITLLTILYVFLKGYPIHYLFGKILYDPTPIKADTLVKSGFLIGALLGWLTDRRFIQFSPDEGSWWKKVFRYVLGIVCLVLIKNSCFAIFSAPVDDFIKYFVIGMYITAIYPFVVKKLNF